MNCYGRPSWDETWLTVADIIAQRSLCSRRKAGIVLVSKDNRVAGTGYNGPPAGYPLPGAVPCDQWCERALTGGSLSYDDCPSVHSEPNALMHSDRKDREGGTAYITSCPCLTCCKNLANSGIVRVVCRVTAEDKDRHPEVSLEFLRQAGLTVEVVDSPLYTS